MDPDLLRAAALLHDVARPMEDEGFVDDHAKEGVKIAREILKRVGFPESKIGKVAYYIEVRRFRSRVKPETIEAQILQDADRLDVLGAISVARVFARASWLNMLLHHPSKPPKGTYEGRSETVINPLLREDTEDHRGEAQVRRRVSSRGF